MSRRVTEASRFTVCFTIEGGTEQRFECQAKDRDDAFGQLRQKLKGPDWQGKDIGSIKVLRIVPCWLGRVGLKP